MNNWGSQWSNNPETHVQWGPPLPYGPMGPVLPPVYLSPPFPSPSPLTFRYPSQSQIPVPYLPPVPYPTTNFPIPQPRSFEDSSLGHKNITDLKAIENHIHELLLFKRVDHLVENKEEGGEAEEEGRKTWQDKGNSGDGQGETDDEEDAARKEHEESESSDNAGETFLEPATDPRNPPKRVHHKPANTNADGRKWVVKTPATGESSGRSATKVNGNRFSMTALDQEKVSKLTIDMMATLQSLLPPPDELARKVTLLKKLQTIVSKIWPDFHPKLHLFGSSANDLCIKNGDIDICMTIDKRAGTKKKIVNKLAHTLQRSGMKKVLSLAQARVPIVKFNDPVSQFSCDICINNVLALHNTRLIEAYGRIDSRVKVLAYIVKYWAKRRKLNEPYTGTLSSYAWVLLVINFLQLRSPPILPCLQRYQEPGQEAEGLPVTIVRGYDCYFYPHVDKLGRFGEKNTETLGELLLAFFELYAHRFKYSFSVVSVRVGGHLTKKEKHWERPRNLRDNHWFSIEDPFETTHDLGRVVDKESLRAIRWELRHACRLLSETGDLAAITAEYVEEEK